MRRLIFLVEEPDLQLREVNKERKEKKKVK